MRKLSPDAPTIFTREAPLHYDDVRLVYPLPDPVTGEPKDTIIAKLVTAKLFYDRHNGTHSWKRRVANSDIIIPWPKTEKKEMEEHDVDTKMLDVEFQNYHPTLLKPPFPQPVIDELRNKYSKYRTRHDPDWLAQKKAEEGAELAKKKIVRTPLQELNRKIRLEKYARGPPVLTEEMLETIGQAMAQSNPQSLERLRASRAAEVAAA